MTTKKTDKKAQKIAFIIMPISDMDGYENGHFLRVYEHLIKPACEKSGFMPIRADEVASSNYIVIDILSKIVESDMVICDLSGKNPNVLYELGIRQAFNFPTVLLKDSKTDKIFDIQGLRYVEYSEDLRIDSVEKQINKIAESLNETEKSKGKDVNSLIQLLSVKSATLPSEVELSGETSVILSAVKDLSSRITSLEQSNKQRRPRSRSPALRSYNINGENVMLGQVLFSHESELGRLISVTEEYIIVAGRAGETHQIDTGSVIYHTLKTAP